MLAEGVQKQKYEVPPKLRLFSLNRIFYLALTDGIGSLDGTKMFHLVWVKMCCGSKTKTEMF